MADTRGPAADALAIALARLRRHLYLVRRLAEQGNTPAARPVVDDVMSDLDDIAGLTGSTGENTDGN